MQFSFNDKKFQTIHLLHVCPWNTMTDPFIVDKQQGGSIGDGRRCEIHISTRRRIFVDVIPIGERSISTSKRKALIIRKRMTYFAFYVGAVVPWRTYLSHPRHCRRSYTPPPISFAIFLKAYSDGLRLTHLHFHKPVLFYASFIRVVNNSSNV